MISSDDKRTSTSFRASAPPTQVVSVMSLSWSALRSNELKLKTTFHFGRLDTRPRISDNAQRPGSITVHFPPPCARAPFFSRLFFSVCWRS